MFRASPTKVPEQIGPSSMTNIASSTGLDTTVAPKSSSGAVIPEELSAIDETKPCVQSVTSCAAHGLDEKTNSSRPDQEMQQPNPDSSSHHKLGIKSKLRGLADRYVSCLQGIDNRSDMRGNVIAGSHGAAVYGSEPFRTDQAAETSDKVTTD
jgi:hypothetical protein